MSALSMTPSPWTPGGEVSRRPRSRSRRNATRPCGRGQHRRVDRVGPSRRLDHLEEAEQRFRAGARESTRPHEVGLDVDHRSAVVEAFLGRGLVEFGFRRDGEEAAAMFGVEGTKGGGGAEPAREIGRLADRESWCGRAGDADDPLGGALQRNDGGTGRYSSVECGASRGGSMKPTTGASVRGSGARAADESPGARWLARPPSGLPSDGTWTGGSTPCTASWTPSNGS